jgi:hypothetical protein
MCAREFKDEHHSGFLTRGNSRAEGVGHGRWNEGLRRVVGKLRVQLANAGVSVS